MKFKFSRLPRAAVACLACLSSTVYADTPAALQSWVLNWEAPTSNDDGSPLTDLIGYYVYVGRSPDALVPYFLSASLRGMRFAFPAGDTHYFAIAAVNADGIESEMSAIVSY
jgi:hypothetical protein